jgi:hypothetical protein
MDDAMPVGCGGSVEDRYDSDRSIVVYATGVRPMRLVLLATAGNQGFIFASNRLREAVGASELVRVCTTDWVDDWLSRRPADAGGTVVQMSSGSTLAVVDGPDGGAGAASDLVWTVTRRALDEAPGLDVSGVSVPIGRAWPTAAEVRAVFAEAARVRGARPGTAARFQRLPVVAGCASTDGPAAAWRSDAPAGADGRARQGEALALRSSEVIAKRRRRRAADRRIRRLVGPDVRLVDIDVFFERVDVVGVVHADGNGMGGLFQQAGPVLAEAAQSGELDGIEVPDSAPAGAAEPVSAAGWLGELSRRVQAVTEEALRHAAEAAARAGANPQARLALVPLVVGGDDVTVLVDGASALAFTEAFLDRFGEASGRDPLVGLVAERATGARRLTAAAGVALVKPHFPFSAAYELAEQLCANAKAPSRDRPGVHAVDVHVMLHSTATPLAELRRRYLASDDSLGAVALHERPFLLAAGGVELPEALAHRDLRAVLNRARMVADVGRDGEVGRDRADGRLVTTAQLHALREDLHADVGAAERRFGYLWRRATGTDRELLGALAGRGGDPPGLLRGGAASRSTPLVDALELAGLLAGAAS